MGAIGRVIRFGLGGVVGTAVGGATAYFLAPQSGSELTGKVRSRIAAARLAGAEAKAAKEQELIGRFRATVNDPGALTATEVAARAEVTAAASAAPT